MAPGRDHGPETLPEPTLVEAGAAFSVPNHTSSVCAPKELRGTRTCPALLKASLGMMKFSVSLQSGPGGFAFYFVLSFDSVDLVQLRISGLSFS